MDLDAILEQCNMRSRIAVGMMSIYSTDPDNNETVSNTKRSTPEQVVRREIIEKWLGLADIDLLYRLNITNTFRLTELGVELCAPGLWIDRHIIKPMFRRPFTTQSQLALCHLSLDNHANVLRAIAGNPGLLEQVIEAGWLSVISGKLEFTELGLCICAYCAWETSPIS